MANYSDPRAVHPTTNGTTSDTVTVGTARQDVETVEIINHDATTNLWVRWQSNGADPGADPTDGGDGSYVVPPGFVKRLEFQTPGEVTVRVASFGATVDYSVEVSS